MLDVLNKIARLLMPLRGVFWVLLFAAVAGFVVTVTGLVALSDAYAIMFLVGMMWALTLLVVVSCFPTSIEPSNPDDELRVELGKRINNAFAWLVGAATVLASAAVVVTTLKLMGIFTSQFTS